MATACWSRPRSAARAKTSAASASCAAKTALLSSFASWPDPSGPEVEDGIAEGLEHGTAALDHLGRAADHDEQLAGGGHVPAAADRCVEDVQVREVGLQPEAGRGVHGAVDHHDRTVGHRCEGAVGPAQHLVDAGVVDDADAEDVRRRRRAQLGVAATCAAVSPKGSSDSGRRAHSVVGKPGVDDPAGHRAALAAEADEARPASP